MTDFEKKILLFRLRREKFTLTKEELDIIIKYYNFVLNIYCEDFFDVGLDKSYDSRFDFVKKLSRNYAYNDSIYSDIFHKIVLFHQYGLLKYLDYGIIHDICASCSCCTLLGLETKLKEMLLKYRPGEDKKYVFEVVNYHNVIDRLVNDYIVDVTHSKFISKEYMNIIIEFNSLSNLYYRDEYLDMDTNFLFEPFLNYLYSYFIINNSFNNDYENVIKFLDSIYNNLDLFIDKLYMIGDLDADHAFAYIEDIYKNPNNKARIS